MRWFLFFLVVCVFVFTGDQAHAQQKKDKPAASDVKGKVLKRVFEDLLPGMGAADLAARNGPQQAWQKICVEASAPGQETMRLEVCQLMSGKLGADVPKPARIWLLQQLQRIGGEESLEKVTLAAQDKDAQVRDEAVRCLANNPSPKATGPLVSLLSGASASAKVGILNALGHRNDRQALPAVAKELGDTDKTTVQAAARALGRMPGQETAKVLSAARGTALKEALAAVNDAYLLCADQLLRDGKQKDAFAIYHELNKPSESKATRLAALQGVLKASGDDAGKLILDILRGEDVAARQIAIAQIENCSAGALKPLGQQLDKLPIPSQVMVLTAMAARGDKSMAQIAVIASESKNEAVQRAGVQALGSLGDASVVPLLLGKITAKSPQSAVASDSLAKIPGDEVTQQLIVALKKEKDHVPALISILQRRKATAAVPSLLDIAGNPGLRNAAFAALQDLAEPTRVPEMVLLMMKMPKGKDRGQAEQTIVAVCAKIQDPEQRADPVLRLYRKSPKEQQIDLLPLLGKLGGKESLKEVQAALASEKGDAFDSAFAALCHWPDASVSDELQRYVQTSPPGQREKALRSLIHVNGLVTDRPVEARLASLKKAMELSQKDDDRKLALEAMGNVKHIDTLRYVVGYLDHKTLSQSACKAVVELAHSKMLREPNRAEFHKALDRVIATSKNQQLVERAKDYKQQP
jgi:HEAT repeat protein